MLKIDTTIYPERWVDYGDSKILIQRPTREQSRKLRCLFASCYDLKSEKVDLGIFLEYQEIYLEHTIKDWKNFAEDQDGNEIKCVLVNNKLDPELLEYLARSSDLVAALYSLISKALDWKETNKKK